MNIHLLTDTELLNLPPLQWLVKDFLAIESKASFWGKPGTYKSFLAFDLAATIAAGLPDWHDLSILPGQPRLSAKPLVIYIAAEGGAGLAKRRRAWGLQHDNIGFLNLRYVIQPVMIADESLSLKSLEEQIDLLIHYQENGEVEEISDQSTFDDEGNLIELDYYPQATAREWPVLIVIDTLAESFKGDENSTADMNNFNRQLAHLRVKYRATILVIHHCGRDPTHERGATAFRGGLDSNFEVFKTEVDNRIKVTLKNDKQRETATGGKWVFEAHALDVGQGETSKVMTLWSGLPGNMREDATTEMRIRALFDTDNSCPPRLTITDIIGQLKTCPPGTIQKTLKRLQNKGVMDKDVRGRYCPVDMSFP